MSGSEDGRSARARRQRERRRAEILAAARHVINARGYAATSVDDMIEAAGVSRGTFYNYFEGREAIFLQLLDDFLLTLVGHVEPVSIDHPAPAAAMYDNLKRVIGELLDNPDLATILFREAVGVNAAIDARIHRFYDFLRANVLGALDKGVQREIIREVDREVVATALVGMIKEVLYQHLVVRSDGAMTVERVTRGIFDFGLRGLRRSESESDSEGS